MELLSHEKSLLLETVKIRITAAKDMLSGLNAAKDSCFSIKLKYDLVQLESLAKKLQEEDKRDIEQLILQDERDMDALFGLPDEPALERQISLQHEQGLNDHGMCAQSLSSPIV